jgi:hypothetical protein
MMRIAEKIAVLEKDHEALLKRRQQLLIQAQRLQEEITQFNEEILRNQGAYAALKELEKEAGIEASQAAGEEVKNG